MKKILTAAAILLAMTCLGSSVDAGTYRSTVRGRVNARHHKQVRTTKSFGYAVRSCPGGRCPN